jgi:hypothetical protein
MLGGTPPVSRLDLIAIGRAKTASTIIRGFEREDIAKVVAVYRPTSAEGVLRELKRGRKG